MPAPRNRRPAERRRRNALIEAGHGPRDTAIDYKDVELLRRFLTDKGKIRSRRVTGVTPQQQRAITRAIKNAREVALLPYAGRP